MINPIILSVVAATLYFSIRGANIRELPANIVMPALLLIFLTPGLLLEIPASGKGVFMSGQSSNTAVAIHAVIVGLIFYILLKKFPQFY